MRFFRKHRHALLLLGVFHFIFFFPTLFMGRVVSPNDILHGFDPWASVTPMERQNPVLNDIATSYVGLMKMVKERRGAFHWNRFVASGIPGFGSVGSAVLTPLVALPALLLPLPLVFTGIILLRVNVAFFFAYRWLREERMRKRGAAAGAMVISAAGTVAVWWLWPAANAIVLYPALLWMSSRLAHGKRVPFTLAALVALCLAFSGYPPAVLFGGYLALLYFTFEGLRRRRVQWKQVGTALGGVIAAGLTAAPFLAPFFQLLRRTGYLQTRANASEVFFYPAEHLAAFLLPYRLGDPVGHGWTGDARFGRGNNFVEATIYVGIVALIVALAGLANRKARGRFFWLAVAVLICAAMFGVPLVPELVGAVPGLEFTPLTRLRYLLPIPVGYLVACAMSIPNRFRFSLRAAPVAIAIVLVAELAFFAARYYPYLRWADAAIRPTPAIEFLKAETPPFRVLPFFYYLLPNSSELFGIEDIRSHFSSEHRYRAMLQRVDPKVWGEFGTILIFHPLRTDLGHPFLRMLGVRYIIEQPTVDVTRWSIDEGSVDLPFGDGSIQLPGAGFRAVGMDVVVADAAPGAKLVCGLLRAADGQLVDQQVLTEEELRTARVYLRLPPSAAAGETFLLRLEPQRMRIGAPASVRLTRAPHVLRRELPDGRIFEVLGALPRYWAVWGTRRMPFEAFLAATDFAPEREVIVESSPQAELAAIQNVLPANRSARIGIMKYGGSVDIVRTTSKAPFLLTSSEKLTPELRIRVDGAVTEALMVNGLFAAVPIAAGEHEIRFERRIGRGFWPLGAAGVVLILSGVIADVRHRRGRATRTN